MILSNTLQENILKIFPLSMGLTMASSLRLQQSQTTPPSSGGASSRPGFGSTTSGVHDVTGAGGNRSTSFLHEPMVQLFGVVLILFVLTAILGLVNFCIWYFEKKRRHGPVHWRNAPIGDLSRPVGQPPKRSFHIQHALYKTVRRPSSMPP